MAVAKTRKRESGSVVRRAAEALRQDVLGRKDGEFLGSESELVNRLGISRPTFRQAAKLVEQEQLLVIKRGVGGGFFARQPSTSAVAHVAAVYLLARRATVADAIRAARPLFADIARNAARLASPEVYARLAGFAAHDRTPPVDFKAFLRSEREFLTIFAGASGNPVLELYATVLVDFAQTFIADSVFATGSDRVSVYRGLRANLIQAILSGDEEVAALMSHRRSDAIISWMQTDAAPRKAAAGNGQSGKRGKQANRQLIRSSANAGAVEDSETASSR